MATIYREACFYFGEWPYKGKGWASLPGRWVTRYNVFDFPFVSYGRLDLRIVGQERPSKLFVVEKKNHYWPFWWMALRFWRFLRKTALGIWDLCKWDG